MTVQFQPRPKQARVLAYTGGQITLREALARSVNPQELEQMLLKADPTYRPRFLSESANGQGRKSA